MRFEGTEWGWGQKIPAGGRGLQCSVPVQLQAAALPQPTVLGVLLPVPGQQNILRKMLC